MDAAREEWSARIGSTTQTPPESSQMRTFSWSVRRELWENRSLYVAPLIVGVVFLLAFIPASARFAGRVPSIRALPVEQQADGVAVPFSVAATLICLTSIFIGVVYCLDALTGERRDRSILFWKSLPLSDAMTVASKAAVPLAVLPAIAFATALATQLVALLIISIALMAIGESPLLVAGPLPLGAMTVIMAYGLVVHALWFAPIYSWLLLVSAWARRAVFVWASLPPLILCVLGAGAFGGKRVEAALRYRVLGAMRDAFSARDDGSITRLSELDPLGFITSPGLWGGLLFSALCLFAAVRIRRRRSPA